MVEAQSILTNMILFIGVQGQGRSYFELSEQLKEGYISLRLQEFCAYYSNRISGEDLVSLASMVQAKVIQADVNFAAKA